MATPVALASIHVDKNTARTRLQAVGAEYQAAKPAWDELCDRLADAVEAARKAGLEQHEVVKMTGLTRETIRRRWKRAVEAERKPGAADDDGG